MPCLAAGHFSGKKLVPVGGRVCDFECIKDAVGAGAGLSTSAGFIYTGERFQKWFPDFIGEYGIQDMYGGGFYTQGDYGLFQSLDSANRETYDNEKWVSDAMEAQGFVRNEAGVYEIPENGQIRMEIPTELIPKCPDGTDITMNLRSDDSFVEDEGWHRASAAYSDFLRRHEGLRVLFLEIGVGSNTPVLAAQCTKDTKKHRKTADLNHFSHKPARMSFRRCA